MTSRTDYHREYYRKRAAKAISSRAMSPRATRDASSGSSAPEVILLPNGEAFDLIWHGAMQTPNGKGALLPTRTSKPCLLADLAPGNHGLSQGDRRHPAQRRAASAKSRAKARARAKARKGVAA